MWRFILIAFLPGLAFAGSVQDETNGCMFKSETAELRECLSDLFYRRGAELDKRIASATAGTGLSDLQADVDSVPGHGVTLFSDCGRHSGYRAAISAGSMAPSSQMAATVSSVM